MGDTFVVSDVHGHLDDLRHVLAQAGLVTDDRWVGGDASLWVLGDLVDRGPDGIGVVRLMRSLTAQAPEQVHMLMGNHESLMLGEKLFPGTRFSEVWRINGGHRHDQEGLTDDDVAWLRGLPAMALAGDHLLMHSDTTAYLSWGSSVDEVNATVRSLVAGDDAQQHFDLFAALTDRYDFAGAEGADVARRVLSTFGGQVVVHGHSIIGSLLDVPSSEVEEPLLYADGLVVDIDGGRYDGGPLLLVRLD
jgi:fructose-1,6-bisphosphatase